MALDVQRTIHRGETITRRVYSLRVFGSISPGLIWLTILFLIPLGLVAVISFLSRGEYGTLERPWTWENYRRLAGFGLLGFDSLYPLIILRSLALGVATAGLCLTAGLPLAFFIARLQQPYKNLALTMVVIPFWTNLLIRTYAWQMLLGPESWLAASATWFGWVDSGEGLYPGIFAVYLCMVCDFLPFTVLPLYASVEKMDWRLVEAAMDLGADRLGVFRHGVVPQIKPGLIAGFILVLLPATGQFVIPDLLGGAKTVMLGNAMQQQFGSGLDWPFGAAIAVVSLGIVMLGFWVFARNREEMEIL